MNKSIRPSHVALMLLGLVCASSSAHAEFINTFPSWNGSDNIFFFGEPNTATYGQTITTNATDVYLQDFSFLIRTVSTAPTDFQAYVMQWDSVNSRATGPVLFQSAAYSNPQSNLFVEIPVPTGLMLMPNTEYVLFFNASLQFDGNMDETQFATVGDVYSGGAFVFSNNGSDFGSLTTNSWTTGWIGSGDLAFKANLVPEPASWMILGSGLVLSLMHNRQRRARKT